MELGFMVFLGIVVEFFIFDQDFGENLRLIVWGSIQVYNLGDIFEEVEF